MGKVKAKEKAGAATKFQRFETAEIARGDVKNAPYNPRRISDEARARLKKKIEEVGLVNVLVWNKRSGNLVSGHQRLSILDELEGGTDYRLTVSVVDVDERMEKELNVFLNNAGAMGDWDNLALAKLAEEFAGELEGLGFADGELDFLKAESGGLAETALPDGGGEKVARETQVKTEIVVVFRDAKETDAFLRFLGWPVDQRYIKAEKVFKDLKGGV